MSESNKPSMRAYGRHVFICTHGDCADPEAGEQLKLRFLALNREHGLNKLGNPNRVKCSLADCLGVCSLGPILTVYPEGIWYHQVDEARLERIYKEHILGGRPVEEYIFHRLYPGEGAGEQVSGGEEGVGVGEKGVGVSGYGGEEEQGSRGEVVQGTEVGRGAEERGSGGEEEGEEIQNPATGTHPVGYSEASQAKSKIQNRALVRRAKKKKGLVIVNTGNGKGKTTAALGVMLRAWGRKLRVGVIQFLKNENARFGEIKAAERMGEIDWLSIGDGWTWTSQDMDETEARARHGWEIAKERILSGNYDLFIMDEFTYPLHYGWLDTTEVVTWLKNNKPAMLHLIITGRYAPEALVEYADLVTEMNEIKHPYRDQGIRAQAGIEY